jgi:hypothetical protein
MLGIWLNSSNLHNEETDNGTDVVGIVHYAQTVALGAVEVFVPTVHLLRRAHHHTNHVVSKARVSISKPTPTHRIQ